MTCTANSGNSVCHVNHFLHHGNVEKGPLSKYSQVTGLEKVQIYYNIIYVILTF